MARPSGLKSDRCTCFPEIITTGTSGRRCLKGTIRMQADRRQYSCPVCNEVVVTEEEQRRRDAVVRKYNESTGY